MGRDNLAPAGEPSRADFARAGEPSRADELPPGTVLHRRYTLGRLLARGGMSILYVASDSHLPGAWVVKQMMELQGNPEDMELIREQFRREAAILSGLTHPGRPRVIDYFRVQGRDFLVEELIEGQSLEELLKPVGRFRQFDVLHLSLQILEVLAYLHGEGIVYRDLKPGNIMVDGKGSVRLVDFGIARLFTAGKRADTVVVGTPGFASPEHYGRGQTDARSDLYSLGATMHYLVTGVDPADAPFHFQSPMVLAPGTSRELSEVIMRALELSPERRFPTAKSMADAVRACTKHRPVRSEFRYDGFVPVRGPIVTGGSWGMVAGSLCAAPLAAAPAWLLLIPGWLVGLGIASVIKTLRHRGVSLSIGDDGLVFVDAAVRVAASWEEIESVRICRTSGFDRTLWGSVTVFPSKVEVCAKGGAFSYTPDLAEWMELTEWIIYRAGLEPVKDVEERGADQVYRR